MAEGIENAPAEVGKGLTHKLGPLPVWGWIVVVAAGAGAYFLIIAPNAAANQQNALSSLPPGTPFTPGGPGGPGGPSTPPTVPPPAIPDNTTWLQKAIQAVSTGLPGISPAEAQLYLQEYLSGTTPVGNSQSVGLFNSVVNFVLTQLGNPPVTPINTGLNTNPYASNQNWLNSLLTFLPSGTSPAIAQELTAWVNGSTHTLSQAAVNALTYAEGIIGLMPTPLTYTIGNQQQTPGKSPWNFQNFTVGLSYLKANVVPALLNNQPSPTLINGLLTAFNNTFSSKWLNPTPQNLITIAYLRQSFINTFSNTTSQNPTYVANLWQSWVTQANQIFQQNQ